MMIKTPLFIVLLFVGFQNLQAQTNLITEDFETDGEGSRYTSNSFDNACNDFFERYMNGGGNCITNEPNNVNGTYYWAGEDVDAASGGTGILTLDPLSVTGVSLELQVLIAIGRPNDGRFEFIDELLFEYNMDEGGWITFAAFYGDNNLPTPNQGNLRQDLDLDGSYDPGAPTVSSSNFTDWTFSIPASGNSLQIRVIMGHDQGTEEVMIDNIRINSLGSLPVELLDYSVHETHNGNVSINWETSVEINNKFFIVEKSMDAVHWEEVAKIEGAGNSSKSINYSILDENPFKGLSYYRLKQKDMDGVLSYLEIKQVNITPLDTQNDVSIYPNPAHSWLKIQGSEIELNTIQLFNSIGQNQSILMTIQKISDTEIDLNISRLQEGIYFLRTESTVKKVNVIR